jgi:DDE_Tnp_1-associated
VRLFDPLIALLSEIPDPRRAEGKLYQLPDVLRFAILAVVTGGNSYRAIKTFIAVNRARLNAAFGLCWKRAPAHTAIRAILHS